jgi:undecaprenyl pyrophosphate phosphatase UppP
MKILRASLAILLLVYLIPAILSVLDIYKNDEPDLSSEWLIVLIFFVLSILLILGNFLELIRYKRG